MFYRQGAEIGSLADRNAEIENLDDNPEWWNAGSFAYAWVRDPSSLYTRHFWYKSAQIDTFRRPVCFNRASGFSVMEHISNYYGKLHKYQKVALFWNQKTAICANASE